MKILITGASGFLGSIIFHQLQRFELISLGRSINSDIQCDLSSDVPKLPRVDILVHAAGKAHFVPRNSSDEFDFYNVNVRGTLNLLKGLELSNAIPKSFVFISSVAVYGLVEGINISENMPLQAIDPYGKSKIEVEKLILNWCTVNNVMCSILRLPLLAGPNPPGNLGAMIKGIKKGYYFNVGNGNANKSVVMAQDVADIIPKVSSVGGIYNLTDGLDITFKELSESLSIQLGKGSRVFNIPVWLAKIIAYSGDLIGEKAPLNSQKLKKIMSNLTFDATKAKDQIGWNPNSVLEYFKI
ncbi:NAD-dependent epimerase/dehydratase family protein [Pedobacter sp. N36a]|uniref:NAD-dependent epimerase/dehydratase family protein n=1 Tax=Pedobacter sp. N36a TaxID=2767996 RepID=UPI001656DD13|nr:NAD-dependent epimerase/dehydratase family protein [Pedobacter sp. N36a]MBC8986170.1 NAD-dependent epimerase/dehydratase family protein [Pedobacter sp. N36a]